MIDVSIELPDIVGHVSVPGRYVDVAVAGGQAYLASQSGTATLSSVAETPHEGFLAVGQGLDRVWMLETDSAGDALWAGFYDVLSDTEYASTIRHTANGGYIVAGGAKSHPDDAFSLFLMRLGAPETHISPLSAAKPYTTHLQSSIPNPFNATTSIRFYVPAPGDVSLRIYDPTGRLVRTLIQAPHPAGTYAITWDGTNQSGVAVAGGVYFYQLMMNGEKQTRRMTLVR
jgi:hypothetical protein